MYETYDYWLDLTTPDTDFVAFIYIILSLKSNFCLLSRLHFEQF